jgi:hypothetical protein
VPVLLRNSLVAPVLQVRRMCCWMDCSLGTVGMRLAAAC